MESKEDKWHGVDEFLGSWQAEEVVNDEFMATAGVPWLLRKLAKRAAPPVHHISLEQGTGALRIVVDGASSSDTLYTQEDSSVTYTVERTGATYEDTTWMDEKGRLRSVKVRQGDSFTVEATREICDNGNAHTVTFVATCTDGKQVEQTIRFTRISSDDCKMDCKSAHDDEKTSHDDFEAQHGECKSPSSERKSSHK